MDLADLHETHAFNSYENTSLNNEKVLKSTSSPAVISPLYLILIEPQGSLVFEGLGGSQKKAISFSGKCIFQ